MDDNSRSSHNLKAEIVRLAQAGQSEAARRIGGELVRDHPDDAESWFLLGAVCGGAGDFVEAERCCRRALVIAPAHAGLNLNLGIALLKQGKATDAVEPLRRAVAMNAGNPDAHVELGNALRLMGQRDEAIHCYESALKLRPQDAGLLCSLAGALHEHDRVADAATRYQQAIASDSGLLVAWLGLADLLTETYRFDGAIRALAAAAEVFPDSFEILIRRATAHHEQGEVAEAASYYHAALALKPNDLETRAAYVNALFLSGDDDAARNEFDQWLAGQPESLAVTSLLGRFGERLNRAHEARARIESVLTRPLSHTARSNLLFSLAKIEDGAGEYDRAFGHVVEANQLKGARFSRDDWHQTVSDTESVYSAEFVARAPRAARVHDRAVFIVGMPRSGTSLVEQIMASHPAVHGAGEMYTVTGIAAGLPAILGGQAYPAAARLLDGAQLDQLGSHYIAELARRNATAPRVTDKAPGNFLYLGLIAQMLPGSRVIHCQRDPMDTCLSCFFQNFSGAHQYAYDLGDLGSYYRGYEKLMRHWHAVLDLPILDVRYEDLVADAPVVSRRMIEFLDLPWDERCLAPHRTRRAVVTASHEQVRRPIYSNSAGRWRAYEKFLDPLRLALGEPK
jgi:tetratricopeptide (TPR) repeat protein